MHLDRVRLGDANGECAVPLPSPILQEPAFDRAAALKEERLVRVIRPFSGDAADNSSTTHAPAARVIVIGRDIDFLRETRELQCNG